MATKKETVTIKLKHPFKAVTKKGSTVAIYGITYRNPGGNNGDCFDLGKSCDTPKPDPPDGDGVILCLNDTWHWCAKDVFQPPE